MSRRRAAGDGSLYYRSDRGLWVAQHNGVYRYSKDRAVAQAKLNELLTQAEASRSSPRFSVVSSKPDPHLIVP